MPTSREALDAQLELLRRKSYSELAQMPPYQEQEVDCSDGRHKLAIWKDAVENSELRVVVQAYKHILLGVGLMQADGFRIRQGGEIQSVGTEELAEYS